MENNFFDAEYYLLNSQKFQFGDFITEGISFFGYNKVIKTRRRT